MHPDIKPLFPHEMEYPTPEFFAAMPASTDLRHPDDRTPENVPPRREVTLESSRKFMPGMRTPRPKE